MVIGGGHTSSDLGEFKEVPTGGGWGAAGFCKLGSMLNTNKYYFSLKLENIQQNIVPREYTM